MLNELHAGIARKDARQNRGNLVEVTGLYEFRLAAGITALLP